MITPGERRDAIFSIDCMADENIRPGQPRTFGYESWSQALEALAHACQGEQRHIAILDKFPYAITSEPGLPSALQNAWDHHLCK